MDVPFFWIEIVAMQLRRKVIQFCPMSTYADVPFRNVTILKEKKNRLLWYHWLQKNKALIKSSCYWETSTTYRTHTYTHTHPSQFVLTEQNLIVCHFSPGAGLTDCFIISRMHVCKLASWNAFVSGRKPNLMPQFIYRAVMRISYGKKLPPFIWWPTLTMPRN